MWASRLGKNNMPAKLVRIALLGAESTGKTKLSFGMTAALQSLGLHVTLVPETLREWCDANGRTPLAHEQLAIAQAQAQRIFSVTHGWVISDTSPLMTAVYSDFIFKDKSLYQQALIEQAAFDMTLVMGLDLEWVPDGLQRDGVHVREPVDTLLRHALHTAGLPFKVIYGQSEARLSAALMAIRDGVAELSPELGQNLASFKAIQSQRDEGQYALNKGRTTWRCDLCSDAECEHKLFSGLLKSDDSMN
jgi:nicotinamide riboside kinase